MKEFITKILPSLFRINTFHGGVRGLATPGVSVESDDKLLDSSHAITHDGRPVRFRTFEKALTTLADVAHLDPEIIVDSSNWCEETGPH